MTDQAPEVDVTTVDDERLKVLAAPNANKDAKLRGRAVTELLERELRAQGYTISTEHGMPERARWVKEQTK